MAVQSPEGRHDRAQDAESTKDEHTTYQLAIVSQKASLVLRCWLRGFSPDVLFFIGHPLTVDGDHQDSHKDHNRAEDACAPHLFLQELPAEERADDHAHFADRPRIT